MVHKLRAEMDAIMVGTNTVLNDNPSLTVRHWAGKNPLRVIVDRTLRIPSHFHDERSTPSLWHPFFAQFAGGRTGCIAGLWPVVLTRTGKSRAGVSCFCSSWGWISSLGL